MQQRTEEQDYLKAMAAAANFAWVNRQGMTHHIRSAFEHVFRMSPEDMEMHLVYDVCHNVAKFEQHVLSTFSLRHLTLFRWWMEDLENCWCTERVPRGHLDQTIL